MPNPTFIGFRVRIRRFSGDFSSPLNAYENSLSSAANFRTFFEWFRDREDLENQSLRDQPRNYRDPQLNAVRHAVEKFLPGFSNLRVNRSPLRMEITKAREMLFLDQLSDGEKCLLAMVGDLARRLAIANAEREVNPLNADGIILIDEIDLHLHPEWQRMIIPRLLDVFPNCQFFVSTHSPLVLNQLKPKNHYCPVYFGGTRITALFYRHKMRVEFFTISI